MDNSVKTSVTITVTNEQKQAIKALFESQNWLWPEEESGREFDPDNVEPGFKINHDDNSMECPHCLCRPCITAESHRQSWWPQNDFVPHHLNSKDRKKCYRAFWTMLFHRNVWRDLRYRQRKTIALQRNGRRGHVCIHKRDIMPDCVVKLVHRWYPNRQGESYMGHMWE